MADKKNKKDKKVSRLEELRAMPADERAGALEAARRAIYQLRRDRLSKPMLDVKAAGKHRKEIARILTLTRQDELKAGK